jgi:hypothetical protein
MDHHAGADACVLSDSARADSHHYPTRFMSGDDRWS